ncbi:hypothetical protein HII31_00373 [Pseudocercospora fuligena]|uniref:Hydrophobin n=1 Tax=Pseudocercospora fuligena TaxID=685502 RepID=A0A8H6RWQ7_9PEZI|nr:hypothetical protein HII31_00373 [Pseudocercospora fuligena]
MYTAIFTLALAASASARPGKRQSSCITDTVNNPNQQQIIDSINQWNSDVNNVNNFLNTAHTLSGSDLSSAANNALISASDEPCQLGTLSSISDIGGDAFTCAVNDLKNIFGTHVLDNLNKILSNVDDTSAVTDAINDINLFRCCNVLPDADILFTDASESDGAGDSVQKTAGRPDACASINCAKANPKCVEQDNGEFGTVDGGKEPNSK